MGAARNGTEPGPVRRIGVSIRSGKIAVAPQSFENPKYLTLAPRASDGRYPPAHLWQDSIHGGIRPLMLTPSSPDQFSLNIGEFPIR